MKDTFVILNDAVLLACASMYFGTGWSLVLFSFPISSQLTPQNYYLQFVPQVAAATRFFRSMTIVMVITSTIMLISERGDALIWVPIVVLLGVVAATWLTIRYIFPLNSAMAAGISDQPSLTTTLARWMSLNRIRVGLWTVQWCSLAAFFVVRSR